MLIPSLSSTLRFLLRFEAAPSAALGGLLLGSSLVLSACGAPAAPLGETAQPFAAGNESGETVDPATGQVACSGAVEFTDPDCGVIARGLCFPTAEAACACAGCGQDECAIAESFPEQAVCPSNGGGSDPDGSTSDDPNAPVSSDPQGGGSDGSSGDGGDGSTGTSGDGTSGDGSTGGGTSGTPGDGNGSSGCATPGHSNAPACGAGVPRDPAGTQRCDFIVGDLCFDSAASGCACAGCSEDRCLVLESYPAQLRCQ